MTERLEKGETALSKAPICSWKEYSLHIKLTVLLVLFIVLVPCYCVYRSLRCLLGPPCQDGYLPERSWKSLYMKSLDQKTTLNNLISLQSPSSIWNFMKLYETLWNFMKLHIAHLFERFSLHHQGCCTSVGSVTVSSPRLRAAWLKRSRLRRLPPRYSPVLLNKPNQKIAKEFGKIM